MRRAFAACTLALRLLAQEPPYEVVRTPKDVIQKVGIDQHLDAQVPLELGFLDSTGAVVRLGDLLAERPVILNLVYYECPMLCTQVLNGLVRALRGLSFDPGREFDVVTVSIDPREKPEQAAAGKRRYLQSLGRPGAERGWHFLVGEERAIQSLARTVGFRYAWDPGTKQFAHSSGIVVLQKGGRIARYFYGIEYPPRDLRLALVEADQGRIGSLADEILLLCFHYDPTTGRYGVAILTLVRLLGVATVLAVVGFVWVMLRRERRRPPHPVESGAGP
jgi:protein SCO1/2